MTIAKLHTKKKPEFLDKKYFVESRPEKHLLLIGRTKLVAMSQLLARWKDILLHLPENRLGLRFARTKQKVGGGERYVPVLQICFTQKLFYPDKAPVDL